jgi:hypothetical protein
MSKAEPEPVDRIIAAPEGKVLSSRTGKHFSLGLQKSAAGLVNAQTPTTQKRRICSLYIEFRFRYAQMGYWGGPRRLV